MVTAVASPPEDKPVCEYHLARNIYEKPRICQKCESVICNKPIAVEPSPGWLTSYHCVKTINHEGIHNNPKIKKGWRLDEN